MNRKKYNYIYGPVSSWRLGSSLGIDPLSKGEKVCTFDCLYCQIGKTKILTEKREAFVNVGDIIEELDGLPPLEIDYITFAGTGEPTLAKNLGQIIKAIKKIRNYKIAVLTNSSLIYEKDVQKDLLLSDFVIFKLDASAQNIFKIVNQPIKTIKLDNIIKAIKDFKRCYLGRTALQIMFIEENKKHANEIAQIAKEIKPDEIQLNTPLRPCRAKPLSRQELNKIKQRFQNLNAISVYDASKKNVKSLSDEDTLLRRGKII